MEARLCELFKKPENYEVMGEKFLGKTLKNKKYKPLFNYFSHVSLFLLFLNYSFIIKLVCISADLYSI